MTDTNFAKVIRYEKFSTAVSDYKHVSVFPQAQIITTTFFGHVLTYFRPMKARVTLLQSKTIVASFWPLMVLICKVFINNFSKR